MHSIILVSLLATAFAFPQGLGGQGYSLPTPSNPSLGQGGQQSSCSEGEVLNVDGSCARPEVSRKIFVYTAPERPFQQQANPIQAPKPKLNYNIVFVRTPEGIDAQEPVVVPPPQQKTIVYVLNKDSEDQGPQMIEVPAPVAHKPEVFYVNYREGENPQLPIGVDLQSALSSAINQQGQSVGGGAVGGGSGGFSTGGGSGFAVGGGSVGGSGGITTGGGSFGGNSGFTSGSGGFVSGGSSGGFVSGGSSGGFVSGGSSGGFSTSGSSGGQGFQSDPSNLYSTPQLG